MTTIKYTLATILFSIICWSCSSSNSEKSVDLDTSIKENVTSTSETVKKEVEEKIANIDQEITSAVENSEEITEEIKETVESKLSEAQEKVETTSKEVIEEATSVANEVKSFDAPVPSPLKEEIATVDVDDPTVPTPAPAVQAVAFTHEIFDGLLRKYVTSTGKVNYNGFKSERAKLQTYLKLLKNNEPKSSWSQNKKLAYWINVYNAFTIELILKNSIPSSIMNINGGKAWDIKFVTIGENTYSLNDVEHNIIRKKFNEPRIHFACVCAAKSCPKLLNKAYTESNLNSSLTTQTKYFINTSGKNQISSSSLKLSKLFEWYAGDFGDVKSYIKKYSTTSFNDSASISFLEYNWDLNK